MEDVAKAITLHQAGDLAQAEILYRRVLDEEPDNFDALHLLGVIHAARKEHGAAERLVRAALALDPNVPHAQQNHGNILSDLARFDEAAQSHRTACALEPDNASIHSDLGNALKAIGELQAAQDSYDEALRLDPALAEAWLGSGGVFTELGLHADALSCFDHAIDLKPDMAEAWTGRGFLHALRREHEAAFSDFDRAFRLEPDKVPLRATRLHARQFLCDWTDRAQDEEALLEAVRTGHPFNPFPLLSMPAASALDQLQCARGFCGSLSLPIAHKVAAPSADGRIRVAYLSADLREHPVGLLTTALFENHDRSGFEITSISLGADDGSEAAARIRRGCERFIDAQTMADDDIVALIVALGVDILVDLAGYTFRARPRVLARRPAPIQVSYLGYVGTTGAPWIDYVIADATLIPADQFGAFSETAVWLPDSFMANDRWSPTAAPADGRADHGLPDEAVVFACFNNLYKIAPGMFDVWMGILRATPNSVLWLLDGNGTATRNLRNEAEARGVDPGRLVFAPRLERPKYLARFRHADLFLDTLPYNAGATASDSLRAGLPVLSCLGETAVGRMAGGLLKAAGLDELVAASLEDYAALACMLAADPARLGALRCKLQEGLPTCAVFDAPRFARHLETAFRTMADLHHAGKPPRPFAAHPAG
jgi:predicted O-linked N-acetylglucosamine transferase (SPINDLY family)